MAAAITKKALAAIFPGSWKPMDGRRKNYELIQGGIKVQILWVGAPMPTPWEASVTCTSGTSGLREWTLTASGADWAKLLTGLRMVLEFARKSELFERA